MFCLLELPLELLLKILHVMDPGSLYTMMATSPVIRRAVYQARPLMISQLKRLPGHCRPDLGDLSVSALIKLFRTGAEANLQGLHGLTNTQTFYQAEIQINVPGTIMMSGTHRTPEGSVQEKHIHNLLLISPNELLIRLYTLPGHPHPPVLEEVLRPRIDLIDLQQARISLVAKSGSGLVAAMLCGRLLYNPRDCPERTENNDLVGRDTATIVLFLPRARESGLVANDSQKFIELDVPLNMEPTSMCVSDSDVIAVTWNIKGRSSKGVPDEDATLVSLHEVDWHQEVFPHVVKSNDYRVSFSRVVPQSLDHLWWCEHRFILYEKNEPSNMARRSYCTYTTEANRTSLQFSRVPRSQRGQLPARFRLRYLQDRLDWEPFGWHIQLNGPKMPNQLSSIDGPVEPSEVDIEGSHEQTDTPMRKIEPANLTSDERRFAHSPIGLPFLVSHRHHETRVNRTRFLSRCYTFYLALAWDPAPGANVAWVVHTVERPPRVPLPPILDEQGYMAGPEIRCRTARDSSYVNITPQEQWDVVAKLNLEDLPLQSQHANVVRINQMKGSSNSSQPYSFSPSDAPPINTIGSIVEYSKKRTRIAIASWNCVRVFALQPNVLLQDGYDRETYHYVEPPTLRACERFSFRQRQKMLAHLARTAYYPDICAKTGAAILPYTDLPNHGVVHSLMFKGEDNLWAVTDQGIVRWHLKPTGWETGGVGVHTGIAGCLPWRTKKDEAERGRLVPEGYEEGKPKSCGSGDVEDWADGLFDGDWMRP